MAIDFLINLLASAAFFILGYSINSIRRTLRLRPYRSFWEPFLREPSSLVVVSTRPGPHVGSSLRVSFIEMEAYVDVNKIMSELGSDVRVTTDEISPDEIRSNNLIILGSPVANRVSKMVWHEIDEKLPFVFHSNDSKEQFISIGERRFVPEKNSAGVWETDYGLIVRKSNPFNQNKAMVVALGCHGLSTFGTMLMMTEIASVKSLVEATKGGDFAVLAQFQIRDKRVISSKIVESYILAHPS